MALDMVDERFGGPSPAQSERRDVDDMCGETFHGALKYGLKLSLQVQAGLAVIF